MTYSKKELKKYLKGLIKSKTGLENLSFEYLAGHSAFHLRLRIIMTSEKIVHWRIPKGTQVGIEEEVKVAKIQEVEFSEEKFLIFLEELFKMKIWDLVNCTDRALPDTALLTFSLTDNDTLLLKQEIWESCRNDDKMTRAVLKSLSSNIPSDWTPP